MTSPELALVVPCYNEASRLDPEAFLRFAATHPAVRLLLVDDGSSDATGAMLAGMREKAPAAVGAKSETDSESDAPEPADDADAAAPDDQGVDEG